MRVKGDGRATDVRARFEQIDLHDSELRGFYIERRRDARIDDAHFDLRLVTGRYPAHGLADARLTLLDCTYARFDVDLTFKSVLGDQIMASECLGDSPLRTELEQGVLRSEVDPLGEYWEFVIHLCPPAGRCNVFARDFRLDYGDRAGAA